jgi:hypothetical protein
VIASDPVLLRKVAEVGAALCAYAPGAGDPDLWPSSRCDCKFGATGGFTEANGCAEARSIYRMLARRGAQEGHGNDRRARG